MAAPRRDAGTGREGAAPGGARRVVVVKKGNVAEAQGAQARESRSDSRRDERGPRPEKSWEPRKPARDEDDGMTYNPFAELLRNREKPETKKPDTRKKK